MKLTILLFAFALAAPAHAQGLATPTPKPTPTLMGWYDVLTPHPGSSQSCYAGPWKTYAAAADWLGSALYLHTPRCYQTGSKADCAPVLGNGYGYPPNYPYESKGSVRVPPQFQIPADAPVQLPIETTPGEKPGFYRIFYGNDGSCTFVAVKDLPAFRLKVAAKQGTFTYYGNTTVPFWPRIGIGFDSPDWVAN